MKIPKNTPSLNAITIARHEINQHLHNVHNSNQALAIYVKGDKAQCHMEQMKINNLAVLKKFGNLMDYMANPCEYDEYMQVNFKKLDIIQAVRSMQKQISEYVSVDNINLQLKTGIESIFVTTDIRRLKKILYNLLSNSMRHTRSGGTKKIVLSVKDIGDSVVVSVRDLSGGCLRNLSNGFLCHESDVLEALKNKEISTVDPMLGFGLWFAVSLKFANEIGAKLEINNTSETGCEASVILPKEIEDPPIAASIVSDSIGILDPDESLINVYFSDIFEEGCNL